MKKIKFSLLLSLLLSIASTHVFAYDVVVDGIYYNLSGTNATVTYENYDGHHYSSPYSGDIVIPASFVYNTTTYNVVSIGSYAFYNCSSPITVTISNGITSIADQAFQRCNGLTSVTIPNSVNSIGSGAFSYCSGLTSISIPSSVTSVGDFAFAGLNLTTMTINKSDCSTMYLWFGDSSFENQSSIQNMHFGTTVNSICGEVNCASGIESISVANGNSKYDSRDGCNAVIETSTNKLVAGCQNTIIPNTVTSIGKNAFYKCSELTTISLPNSITSIGEGAFSGSGLTTLTIPNSVTSIGGYAFYHSGLTTLTIPNSVTSIGAYAFNRCEALESITLPNSITTIGEGTFFGCSSLINMRIPSSVTSIGQIAFRDCTNMTSIFIPNSVISIGQYAFQDCSSLLSVKVDIDEPIDLSFRAFYNVNDAILYVPYNCKTAYEGATQWKDFKDIIETTDAEITIGESGMATYCSRFDLDFSGTDDVKAFIVSAFKPSTGEVVLTRMTDVPAGTGIIVKGSSGSYNVPISTSETVVSNMLVGVTSVTTLNKVDGEYTNYILAKKAGILGFYAVKDGSILDANKAYLPLLTEKTPANAPAFNLVFDDDETTAIKSVKENTTNDNCFYNLKGQRVENPVHGVYIFNGKKIVVK